MAGLPTIQVSLDDDTGTFPYDISSKARLAYTISRGRQDEQSQVNPGQLTLILDNTDGRFTPGSTIIGSPSPVKADARIRVKVTANATTVNRFTGYVQSWPVTWPSGGDTLSEVTITAVDAQARAERWPLLSLIEQEILSNAPSAYYTFGEPAGATSAGDSSGNQGPALAQFGPGAAAVFGTDIGLPTTGATTFGSRWFGTRSGPQLAANASFLIMFASTATTAGNAILQHVPSAGDWTSLMLRSGSLTLESNTYGIVTLGSGSYNDGSLHVVGLRNVGAFTYDVYVDGALTNAGLPVPSFASGYVNAGQYNGTGTVAHLAWWTSAPSGAAFVAMAQAESGFTGESGTARITRLAGYAGLPVGTLDTSLTNVASTDITNSSASSALQEVASAEFGLVFFDGSGNLTFHNRNRATAKTTYDITVDANQLDPGTAFTTDMQGVVNYFAATAAGGTGASQIVRDAASETSHGRYATSATYLVLTDAEALDRANWIVVTHKEPGPRVGTLVVDLLTLSAAQQAAFLAVEPNHWIRVTGLPSQTPGGTSADFTVQGFSESMSPTEWTLALNVTSRVLNQAWILGDPTYGVLDSTTRLYV